MQNAPRCPQARVHGCELWRPLRGAHVLTSGIQATVSASRSLSGASVSQTAARAAVRAVSWAWSSADDADRAPGSHVWNTDDIVSCFTTGFRCLM